MQWNVALYGGCLFTASSLTKRNSSTFSFRRKFRYRVVGGRSGVGEDALGIDTYSVQTQICKEKRKRMDCQVVGSG